uniref:C-type lectin domain-containing protein n=1 Tax=Strigamia maritima TaxID=126957 RepID=T1J6E7_STRMM
MLQRAISSNKTFSEQCSKSFIGFRRIISEEWKTSKNEPIIFDNNSFVVPRSLPVKNNCVAMLKEYNYSISNVECRFNDPLKKACYICESQKCNDNVSQCYKVFIDAVDSIQEASAQCQVEMSESQLASIGNFYLHRDILQAYRVDDPKSICSYIYLGMRSNWIYENVYEEKILYESERLNSLEGTENYCVSVDTGDYEWKSQSCEEKMCFICR